MAGGFCDYFIEEKYENEWYVYESDSEADGVGGNTYSQYAVDGPFNKYDAIQCLNKYRREAKEFRRNYGTIYNLIPEADINIIDGDYTGWYRIVFVLMSYLFLIGPLYLLYKYYDSSKYYPCFL